jgi:hypothetical protein
MKKYFCLLILLFFTLFTYSQELNETAQKLKDAKSSSYQLIKEFAVDKWNDDHTMIVHEINRQVEAYEKIAYESKKEGYDELEMAKALREWSTGEPNTPEFRIDFIMVWHEYNKQMKAKKAY